LVIIGVSDETEQKLSDHIAAKGIKYPIVRATDGMSKYGGKFYPSYFTISPDGTILTTPAERVPSESWFQEALKSVVRVPDLPEDSRFDPLRKAWEKSDYKRIDSYLTKMLQDEALDPELRAVFEEQRASFDGFLAGQLARIDKFAAGPDYWDAQQKLEQMVKDFDGLEVEERAKAVLDRFGDDATIKKEISASRALEKVMSRFDANKISQRRKLVDALLQFEERYAGTYAGQQATQRRVQLAGG
jgi:hypothetical protein